MPFRWWIVILLFGSTTINYIDRQTLSVLAPYLKREFAWSNSDFALLVIAFRAAYAIFQPVSGRVLDRLGTKRGLSLAVLWYSAVAVATSLATGLASFAAFRFLLGAGEAANWPGATKAVSEGFPKSEGDLAVFGVWKLEAGVRCHRGFGNRVADCVASGLSVRADYRGPNRGIRGRQ